MTRNSGVLFQRRIFAYIALGASLLFIIPWVAMQLSDQVQWDETDFVVMWLLFFSFASGYVLLARRFEKRKRWLVGSVLFLTLIYIWAELAVGIFTRWGS
ncbi:hypothetical protein [Aliidiomarina sanyensis]|uniref:Uncharacterized protein n=1 Tax=Aliidiomarina sanyensis TaxID=1249555 RepID=A0A432WRJ3_9GAMM|nr:hypothetical protein [Aliidiomarina sanyensis]RUO36432.1 hypothetical protein CWE11_01030 [Aliidiomarina sanyensis]